MKNKLYILLIIGFLSSFFSLDVNAETNYFVVTAYYSPLSNQEHYSYNAYKGRERTFEEEKRLQGEGIRGASGKPVFSGMLAAPKNYKFGTKIYLEGLGIGVVEDRGGAIVNKGNRGYDYDRIDVWMGYGDEGLRRALYWGKRTIKGSFLSNDSKIDLDYKKIASPLGIIKSKKYLLEKEIDIFSKNLTSIIEYKKLQEILIEMNLYSGEITGDYSDLIDSIFKFQIDHKIVNSEFSLGAGTYGPKTRKKLKEEYNKFLVKKEEKRLELIKLEEERKKQEEKRRELLVKVETLKNESNIKAKEKINFIGSPKFGEISHSVRELQLILKNLGYFDNKDTAIFGEITKKSIIAYQIDKKIINSKNDLGAGIIGPKTKKSIESDLFKMYLMEIVKKENLIIKI